MISEMKDLTIQHLINAEEIRTTHGIELIASENYVSRDVLLAQGSVLTNKYAEGLPFKRYYGGCEVVDQIEQLAIDRAKKLFNCEYVNVQPHSGSQANAAALAALISAGDKVLGMSLNTGGHLTHGSPVNFSGKLYEFQHYGVGKDGLIDYDEVERIAIEFKPNVIIAGYSAYSRELNLERFKEIADKVDAYLMVDMAHFAGLVAGRAMQNPINFADIVTSTTHKTLRGPRGGLILTNDEKLAKKINSAVFPGQQGGPLLHVIAAKAVCFQEASTYEFGYYIHEVRSYARMAAEMLIEKGFKIVSGGTDNHMFLMDFTDEEFTGKDVEGWLGQAGITVNKNTVPDETRSPFVTSGIRIGFAAIASRGFNQFEVGVVVDSIAEIIESKGDSNVIEKCKKLCADIAMTKPIYPVSMV